MHYRNGNRITDEVVVDLSATVPSDTTASQVSVYFYPTSVKQVAASASKQANETAVSGAEALNIAPPVPSLTFAGSTVAYTQDQLEVVGTIGTIVLRTRQLAWDSAKGAFIATFAAASPAVALVASIATSGAAREFIVNVKAKNNDNTARLYHFPNLASVGAEAVSVTAGTKIPLVLVHGIQLFSEGCGANSAYKGTWDKFRTNFFGDSELPSKYELYSFSYPTNIDFKANGASFSKKLSAVFGNKPVVVVAHSMGGLVTRAADVYYSTKAQSGNITDINISRVITLDTPHHGTPYINRGAAVSELLCVGDAQAAGGPSLAWDDLENNRSCTNSGNPVLCELNSPQNLQHLKKYVPYSAYSDIGATFAVVGATIDAVASAPLFLWRDLTNPRQLLSRFTQLEVDKYFLSSIAKQSDLFVLLPSQRLMSVVDNQWVDNPALFADLPDAYPATLHVDSPAFSAAFPGIVSSTNAWLYKADGTRGGISGHLNSFALQITGKPDLIPSAVTTTPASVQPGASINVSWRITNSGNANAAASTTGLRLVSAATSGNGTAANNLINVPTGALAAGGVANQSQAITIPAGTAPGSYVVVVAVDNVAPGTLGQSNVANDYARSAVFSVGVVTQSTNVFTDNFDGTALQSSVWSAIGAGTTTVANGSVSFSCFSSATTAGKLTFTGGQLVVEAGLIGVGHLYEIRNNLFGKILRDSAITLTDLATGDRIVAGDTNYFDGGGLYLIGTGIFNLPQFGNGISSDVYMEYRLTVSESAIKLERGTSLANITDTIDAVMPASITGKSFYLTVGTGGPDYCPSVFNWVTVKSFP
jgi:pimeloyl-ACP methyl ester carboxylesterase